MDQYRNALPEPNWSRNYLNHPTVIPTMQHKRHPPASNHWTLERWIAKGTNYLQI